MQNKKVFAGQNAAALEMFSKNGYAGTNIRELSASPGLVKSGVYLPAKPFDIQLEYRL